MWILDTLTAIISEENESEEYKMLGKCDNYITYYIYTYMRCSLLARIPQGIKGKKIIRKQSPKCEYNNYMLINALRNSTMHT